MISKRQIYRKEFKGTGVGSQCLSVVGQHYSRERGSCPRGGLLQFLQETKPRTLGYPHWMAFAHWLTKWTRGTKGPLYISIWIVHLILAFCFMHLCLLIWRTQNLSERQTWDTARVLIRTGPDLCLSGQLVSLGNISMTTPDKLQKYLWLYHNFRFPHTLQTNKT